MRDTATKILMLIISLVFLPAAVVSQDTYNQEYDHYMKAEAETNRAKREAVLMEFVRTYPESELDPNISYLYAQFYQPLRQAGRWQQMAAKAEQFLRHRPNDTSSIQAATEAYQRLGNVQKLVDFGSKLYAERPSASTAHFVAKAYQSLGNEARFRTWAERTLKHGPNNLDMLVELATSYWGTGELTRAASYANKGLGSVAKTTKPDNQSAEQFETQLNQVRGFFYRTRGEKAYQDKNINSARENFESSVEYDPNNDFAHYRLGFIHWGAGKSDQAILSFAKAVVLKGSSLKDARDQLYQLYRSAHSNTSGLPTLLRNVRKDMGL